jgi:hypothetical protein
MDLPLLERHLALPEEKYDVHGRVPKLQTDPHRQ